MKLISCERINTLKAIVNSLNKGSSNAKFDFMSALHKNTKRDYLARVNDKEFPKYKAAELAKKFDYDYWDGDRRINYGDTNI